LFLLLFSCKETDDGPIGFFVVTHLLFTIIPVFKNAQA
ncbi:MAG: hypothetical protein ACI9DK_002080, partial [Vicingaceae bacterium]